MVFAAVALLGAAVGLAFSDAHAQAVRPERKEVPPIAFRDENGATVDLSAFRGKVVVLDFWATWCKPCRDEMPSLDRLQARLDARGLVVVPISVDFRGLPAIDAFYRELNIQHLAKYVDDTRETAKVVGLTGLPGALALDRQGREVFRVEGPIDWSGLAVVARLDALLRE